MTPEYEDRQLQVLTNLEKEPLKLTLRERIEKLSPEMQEGLVRLVQLDSVLREFYQDELAVRVIGPTLSYMLKEEPDSGLILEGLYFTKFMYFRDRSDPAHPELRKVEASDWFFYHDDAPVTLIEVPRILFAHDKEHQGTVDDFLADFPEELPRSSGTRLELLQKLNQRVTDIRSQEVAQEDIDRLYNSLSADYKRMITILLGQIKKDLQVAPSLSRARHLSLEVRRLTQEIDLALAEEDEEIIATLEKSHYEIRLEKELEKLENAQGVLTREQDLWDEELDLDFMINNLQRAMESVEILGEKPIFAQRYAEFIVRKSLEHVRKWIESCRKGESFLTEHDKEYAIDEWGGKLLPLAEIAGLDINPKLNQLRENFEETVGEIDEGEKASKLGCFLDKVFIPGLIGILQLRAKIKGED